MIYLVGSDIDVSGESDIKKVSVEESKQIMQSWPVKQYDSETSGLDARICHLWSMQFGYKDFHTGNADQIVIDNRNIRPEVYKDVLEQSYLIGHNIKFDEKFLFNHDIIPRHLYDTMICEQVLYLGYKPKQISFNLHDVLKRYTGIELDKTIQKTIAYTGLKTVKDIRYAAGDVIHLQDIRKGQLLTAQGRNCIRALSLENRFIPAISYLEWCGVHLDEVKWKIRMAKNEKALENALNALNEYILSNDKLSEFVSTSAECKGDSDDTIGLFTFDKACTVDWNSPKQVAPVFKKLGFDISVFDKDAGEEKESVSEKLLSFQTGIDDYFLNTYLDYKGFFKSVSSYGQGHLNQINPYTNRIHTEFRQIGTVTGRMSSGSKQKNRDLARVKKLQPDDVSYCNMQNLPARGDEGKRTRECFTSMPGNTFISCDYSAEEARVQADVWNEQSLLDAFANGLDTHNLYAKMCFPDELVDVDVGDVKTKRPDLRQKAKSAEFAVGYGSDGTAIAATIGMPIDKAKQMVSNLLKGMPGMAAFKKRTTKFLKEHGYIVINEQTGHRIYWPEWAKWKAQQDKMDKSFWNEYNARHRGTGDRVCEMVAKHKSIAHDWFEKNVLNYPIQGGSAIVLKQAAADLFDWVVDHGYFKTILFCVFVHDEICAECPSEMADSFSNTIERIMANASAKFYHKLPIPSEASAGDHWIH